MKNTACCGIFLILFAALAAPGFAQEIKDPAEYNAYSALYQEKDPAKKAAMGEKFLMDYPKTVAVTQTYMIILLSYARIPDWMKALETADKQEQMASGLGQEEKKQVLLVGMAAAEQLKNVSRVKDYAEKILAADPKNIGALVTLSAVLASTPLPTDEGAKAKRLDETLSITQRALAEPRPEGTPDAQWNQVTMQLHDTSAMVLLNQKKYSEATSEAQAALKIESKDGYAYYLLGLATKPSVVEAINNYNAAVKKINDNATADQPTRDDLKAAADGFEKIATTKTDELIDLFAKSVATGWPGAANARNELKIFKGTPDELEKLISEKKVQLGIK
jgi:tetratricopeptide (TPR) repeat protein